MLHQKTIEAAQALKAQKLADDITNVTTNGIDATEALNRFIFNPATDESVDHEYILLENPTITIQCCAYDGQLDYCVNEHGGEGGDFWFMDHGTFSTLTEAKMKALKVAS
jgi:hypothetical protein